MQPQPVDWLEIIKATAPYVTAIIAIIASTFAAWMTHRNWLKQFMIEKSYLRRQEQVRLLQEIHVKLSEALNRVVEAQWEHLFSRLIKRLLRENQSFPAEERAGFENLSDQSLNKYLEIIGQLSEKSPEYSALSLTTRIYFGKETSRVFDKFVTSLNYAMSPADNFMKLDDELYPTFLKAGIDQGQGLQQFDKAGKEKMLPLFAELHRLRALVIENMVEYMEKNA